MYKKTAIIFCLFSMIFAQDNVELEENRHFNSYQINLDRFKQLNEDITTPNTYRTAAGYPCLLYTSPSPRDRYGSRMPSSA